MNEEYPIVVKTYTLTRWYIEKLSRLPKNHRYTLGEKVQQSLLELLLLLSDAIYSKERTALLHSANKEIEKLRLLTRLMKDLQILSATNSRFVATHLNEIGKMIGGWLKS